MQDDCIIIALGLPEVRVVREEETAEAIVVEVAYRAESAVCPRCGWQTPKVHSTRAQLKREMECALGQLWALARVEHRAPSVTSPSEATMPLR